MSMLYLSYKKLTELPPLPPNLTNLCCYDNLITELPQLPPFLKILSCENNPLAHLPQLPQTLENIYISPWQVPSCLNKLSNLKTSIIIMN
jgi:Leucine-rich repeat (LRR) protein